MPESIFASAVQMMNADLEYFEKCADTCYVLRICTLPRPNCRKCEAKNTVLRRIDPVAYYEHFFKEAERLSFPIRQAERETPVWHCRNCAQHGTGCCREGDIRFNVVGAADWAVEAVLKEDGRGIMNGEADQIKYMGITDKGI